VIAQDTPVPTPVLTCDVVIATQSVARGQTLSEAVLGLVPYDCPNVQPGMMFNIFDAAGQRTRSTWSPGGSWKRTCSSAPRIWAAATRPS
jgi:flagella basal body P-ring formation protein FlgA